MDALPALDFCPPEVDAPAWQTLVRGLHQRMRLIDALTQDLYGPQLSLQQGRVPTALTHGHSGYVPALQGLQPLGGTWLGLARFEVARDLNGAWWVLQQHTGVALRLPDRWRQHRPSVAEMEGLKRWRGCSPLTAPDSALLVALVPSSLHPRSQAPELLAPWGVTLACPEHLVVRDHQLWLLQPSGPSRVHGLINMQPVDVLDPLELQAEVSHGITGLFEALRLGQVMMMNMPGLGFWNTPAWQGFWAALSEQWLGEPLMLPSLPTWWMGEALAQDQAYAHAQQAWLLPTYGQDGLRPTLEPVPLAGWSPTQRHEVLRAGGTSPADWTLQGPWWGEPGWQVTVLSAGAGHACLLDAVAVRAHHTAGAH